MVEDVDTVRRKRLAYQCAHRGMKEMDLILSAFAADELARLSASELDDLETVIKVPDDLLYAWISGRVPVPPEHAGNPMLARIIARSRGKP